MSTHRWSFASPGFRAVAPNAGQGTVYDDSRQYLLSYGHFAGGFSTVQADDLWELDLRDPARGWRRIYVQGVQPEPRSNHATLWDSVRKRMVVQGGLNVGLAGRRDTWAYYPATETWEELEPGIDSSKSPFPTFDHQIAYDAARDVYLHYGGARSTSGDEQDHTWQFIPADGFWSQQMIGSPPGPLVYHVMWYSARRGRIMLHGGASDAVTPVIERATWEWDGAQWVEVTGPTLPTPAQLPGPIRHHPGIGAEVMFGGYDDLNVYQDVWILDDRGWHKLPGATVPNFSGVAVCHKDLDTMILLGGFDPVSFDVLTDVWSFGPGPREQYYGPFRDLPAGLVLNPVNVTLDNGATLTAPATSADELIEARESVEAGALQAFTAHVDEPASTAVLFALLVDGAAWYWTGAAWASSDLTAAQMSTAADIDANLGTLSAIASEGSLVSFAARLTSSAPPATPTLEAVDLRFTPSGVIADPPRYVEITGNVRDIVNGLVNDAVLTVRPPRDGFFHGRLYVEGVEKTYQSDDLGNILAVFFETESVGVDVELEISGGPVALKVTRQIPDRDTVTLAELFEDVAPYAQ